MTPGTGYTVDDTPEVVARIEGDLAKVAAAARKGDPRLRSLVLTGGFARGEGAVRGGQPQNDYDLVAVRDPGPPRIPYDDTRRSLEKELGLHIDLAPVHAWRLPFVPASIFWYEVALRGRVVWGEEVLDRIPRRPASSIPPKEGLRLLVNRSAGLLFSTAEDGEAKRLQACKAILAAMDACLLADGRFAPSQTERWATVQAGPPRGAPPLAWMRWAYRYKTDPDGVRRRDGDKAWAAARDAILQALPHALAHAGFAELAQYGRSDRLVDHVHYALRSQGLPTRLTRHPTGRVRVATLEMLAAARPGAAPALPPTAARLAPPDPPLVALERLRSATLQ